MPVRWADAAILTSGCRSCAPSSPAAAAPLPSRGRPCSRPLGGQDLVLAAPGWSSRTLVVAAAEDLVTGDISMRKAALTMNTVPAATAAALHGGRVALRLQHRGARHPALRGSLAWREGSASGVACLRVRRRAPPHRCHRATVSRLSFRGHTILYAGP